MSNLQNNISLPDSQSTVDATSESNSLKYVVVRDGYRVSDNEYDVPTDMKCLEEIKFWLGVAHHKSHGEVVEAVPYDLTKHRIW